jgi:hypothetical protein
MKLKEHEDQCFQLKTQINFAHQHQLHQNFNQIKSVEPQLKTGIAESLRKPLMKIAQKLLISDKSTFEQLTPSEQTLCTCFETEDIYRFPTGELDTVPEFQYSWTSIPRLQPLGPTISPPPSTAAPAPPAPAAQPPPQVQPPAPQPPPESSSSGSSSSSSPHSSPTPPTSGTRPKQSQPATPKTTQPDPSGASTLGTTPPANNPTGRNLRQHTKVDYKDLHTGA